MYCSKDKNLDIVSFSHQACCLKQLKKFCCPDLIRIRQFHIFYFMDSKKKKTHAIIIFWFKQQSWMEKESLTFMYTCFLGYSINHQYNNKALSMSFYSKTQMSFYSKEKSLI